MDARAARLGLWGGILTLGAGACNLRDLGSTQPCPDDMVYIASGPTQLGFPPPLQPWMEPARMVTLGAYCIDRYEWPNKKGVKPEGWLTWDEARANCESIGKRLCTSAEWERACKGLAGNRYSYGRHRDASACNTPIDGAGPGMYEPPLAPSGSFERCHTAGACRPQRHLSEWTSDGWNGAPEPFNPEATVDAHWFTLRGGTMWNRTFYGQDCSSRHGHRRSFENMDDGARCCQTAGGW